MFPKLPVYLRTYFKAFERNLETRRLVRAAQSGTDKLREINTATANVMADRIAASSGNHGAVPPATTPTETLSPATFVVRRPRPMGASPHANNGGSRIVGGHAVVQAQVDAQTGDEPPDRKRRSRRCTNCVRLGEPDEVAMACPGRGLKDLCES